MLSMTIDGARGAIDTAAKLLLFSESDCTEIDEQQVATLGQVDMRVAPIKEESHA